ncbi:bifunctional phosphopantothenoylcysteine decarboxylase/phosphopantothenate--cysteine ligase CoaBC [Anaerotruncus sp. X29]|uniref:bifunctional phosphopantothenoylcysteine decarboxylase/phosphopantothenate--cysteine ligase CoaBC n=1 Tax=Anaerotruncus sp. G3(2012) TaxID=1235835 RepID=UPI0003376E1D|nr:bifunctional phosphopantothenoylcysteine decarboxylase/phosphopantothenate--cysteine ligase CoaBC [Anaerotruncus sp. G3(2012)]EOS62725.1 phosphopantothenoylcysteine decarboxylase/phosphopantothenate-cysteine ligase [Anaerotruncus sp. G3(2012)]MCI9160028.1 bifunctional phosphopantothenoylcysteine decarboxylase/phosphopantothenate--cysteine ligase CoaBC [Anaerotruncus sp.]NCE75588.1 bifunctional phosphopantothenoylcysteine decarboxylase/phosphopantothenate--cysteine ligase CoaBC [Anaerotruncus 
MFDGKTIVLGVSGGIAAYKAAQLASDLGKTGADVHVIMTRNATEFVSPMTFETLVNNRVAVDTFDRGFEYNVEHVALAKKADVFLIAPATANVIAKMAAGIADDMLTTTVLAARCPKIVAPAMNTGMYDNPVTQRNLQTLRAFGVAVVEPESGYLACGDTGRGRLAEEGALLEAVRDALTPKDLAGLSVLVTAGPTREAIDPVRYITNHSTGKMGYEVAAAAKRRGASVTLVSGPTSLKPPYGVTFVPVHTAQEMFDEVTSRASAQQMVVKCAAVADYRPATTAEDKIKKQDGEMQIALTRTRDILGWLGEHRVPGQVLCGFSMETRDMVENSAAKLEKKRVDMIVANNLKEAGAGFGTETNIVTILTKAGAEPLPIMGKDQVADEVLTRLLALRTETGP